VKIDLHAHSTASDGTDTPAELVAKAAAAGLDVVAITDHDTTAGWQRAVEALPTGLTLVRGAEYSCVYTAPDGRRTSLHLLGYLFDPDDPALRAERIRLRDDRRGRGHQIVDKLVAEGYPVTWARVSELAGGGSVGRPHIARVLVEEGVVGSVNEAFADLLSSRSRFYADKEDTDVFTALELVLAAGGVPVFAHPRARRRGAVVDDEVIARMAAAGLVGIEINHPDQDEADRGQLRGLAADLGLIATGSSDYHGTNKTTQLGAGLTEPAAYEQLFARNVSGAPIVLSA
jgi:predicted metal-dependent phosphoesterase TrpH